MRFFHSQSFYQQKHAHTASQHSTPHQTRTRTHFAKKKQQMLYPPLSVSNNNAWVCLLLCVLWKSSMKMSSNNHKKNIEYETNKGNEFWSVNENSLRMWSNKQKESEHICTAVQVSLTLSLPHSVYVLVVSAWVPVCARVGKLCRISNTLHTSYIYPRGNSSS